MTGDADESTEALLAEAAAALDDALSVEALSILVRLHARLGLLMELVERHIRDLAGEPGP